MECEWNPKKNKYEQYRIVLILVVMECEWNILTIKI